MAEEKTRGRDENTKQNEKQNGLTGDSLLSSGGGDSDGLDIGQGGGDDGCLGADAEADFASRSLNAVLGGAIGLSSVSDGDFELDSRVTEERGM